MHFYPDVCKSDTMKVLDYIAVFRMLTLCSAANLKGPCGVFYKIMFTFSVRMRTDSKTPKGILRTDSDWSPTSCPQRMSRHPQTCSSTRWLIWKSPSPGPVHPARLPLTGCTSPPLVLTALRRGSCSCLSPPTHMLISPTCSRAHCTAFTSTPSMVEWRASPWWEKGGPVSTAMDKGVWVGSQ